MNSLFPETSGIIYALGWALVHSVWQGLLVYALLKLALRYIPGNYANVRYYSAVSSLGVLTASFLCTLLYYYTPALPEQVAGTTTANAQDAIAPAALLSYNNTFIERLLHWYSVHTDIIVTLYLAGISLLLIRLLYNLFTINTLKTRGISPAPATWLTILNNSVQNLQISKHVSLLLSEKVSVPMVMGTLKPVILMPVALANKLTTQEVEAILLHELAHVKRNDYLINIIQMFIETVLFYNPFVWLISSIIRKEREHCCDDIVVMKTPDRLPYAKALATLETYRLYPTQPALAATGSKNELLTRIKRIMEMKKNNINYGQLTAVLLVVIFLLASVTFIIPEVNAQDKKDKKKKDTTTSTTKVEETTHSKDDQNPKKKVTASSTSTGSNNGRSNKTTVVFSDDDDDVVILEEDIEKEALKTAKLALEAANETLAELDLGGIIKDAMKGIEWESFYEEIQDSMSKEDWEGVQKEMRAALRQTHSAMAEARKEMAAARKNYSKEIAEANKQMAEARKQMAEAHKQLAEARKQLAYASRDEIKKQREAFDNDEDIYIRRHGKKTPILVPTKIQVASSHDKLLKAMERDGLIDRVNGFKIEKKGNELYIDGIKQSKEVVKKYDRMLGKKNLTIKGNYRTIKISTSN